jgi:hypothetical protein
MEIFLMKIVQSIIQKFNYWFLQHKISISNINK